MRNANNRAWHQAGFGDAIENVWPQTTVQTCVVHLIRLTCNSVKYCSWKDRKAVTKAFKPIYQAATVEAAADAVSPPMSTAVTLTPSSFKRRLNAVGLTPPLHGTPPG